MALPFQYNDFHGGLNTLDAPFLLTDNQARDLSNVQGTTAGAVTKRGGWQTLRATPHILDSLFAPVDGNALIAVDMVAGNILSITSWGGATATLKTGLTGGNSWEWVRGPVVGGQGPTYGMSGSTDTPQQWNEVAGTTTNWTATDAGGTVPNGQYCIYHQNQVYVAGTAANPSRLYWSGIADPTAWNPANLNGSGFMDFDPNDGQVITGIGIVGPYVAVFKETKTWILISAATATARKLSEQIGCTSHRSIAAGSEGTYFLGVGEVYLTNGSKITPISDKVTPTIAGGTFTAGCYINRHYYLSGSVSGAGVTLDYDARLASWWKHSIAAGDWTIAQDNRVVGQPQLVALAANRNAAFVSQTFQPGVFQDNGANFTWIWRGPWQSPTFYRRRRFPTPYFRKRLRQVRVDGFGTVDFSVAKDFAGLESLWQANVFGYPSTVGTWADAGIFGDPNSVFSPGSVQRARFYSLGVANAFSMVFSATSNSADSIFEYTMMVTDRRDSVT